MLFISHRGNLNGPNPAVENKEEYLEAAIAKGFDVELDVWKIDSKLMLGHDRPDRETTLAFLTKHRDKLWIHCKNLEALEYLRSLNQDFNFFWHQQDDFTLTSKNYIWTYPGKPIVLGSVFMSFEPTPKARLPKCHAVCSDYVGMYL